MVDINWGDEGRYITTMAHSPGKRYICYVAEAGSHKVERVTLVQYDTKTDRR